jgi:hypothetical protein
LVPKFVPFTFHWYAGVVPPLTGVAVNVTDVPGHIGFEEGTMLTLDATFGLTVMLTVFEVAGLPVVQAALEVITQVTASKLANVLLANVGKLKPAFTPFTLHW